MEHPTRLRSATLLTSATGVAARRLWQWDQIDLFIYFSHHLITVPPPAWTAAAHRNGVRVGEGVCDWREWPFGVRHLMHARLQLRRSACGSIVGHAFPGLPRTLAEKVARHFLEPICCSSLTGSVSGWQLCRARCHNPNLSLVC